MLNNSGYTLYNNNSTCSTGDVDKRCLNCEEFCSNQKVYCLVTAGLKVSAESSTCH